MATIDPSKRKSSNTRANTQRKRGKTNDKTRAMGSSARLWLSVESIMAELSSAKKTLDSQTTASGIKGINEKNMIHNSLRDLETEGTGRLTQDVWDTIRRAAGRLIDIETADIIFFYPRDLEPDGDDEPGGLAIRDALLRAPGSEEWIHDADLPQEIRGALWFKYANYFEGVEPDREK